MFAETDFRKLTECRICKGGPLASYLNLGRIPLVNSYVSPSENEREDRRFPLEILYCRDCSLSQLSIVVHPGIIYKNYCYRSSISQTFTIHCRELAQEAARRFHLTEKDLVIDIASNDGCALKEFKKLGARVLGVDPAQNLARIAVAEGIPTLPRFWKPETARRIAQEEGLASIITAMNVFAHVDDLDDFLDGIQTALKEDGIFIIEVPYLLNFVNKTEFDTSYHEHLSYFLVKPLIRLFERHRMKIFDIKQFTIHGGSIRIFAKKEGNADIPVNRDPIQWLVELESDLGLHDLSTYLNFSRHVEKIKTDLMELLVRLKNQGKRIAAYGASAKGNVLSNYCGIGKNLIDYIVDDTPEKQGFLTPGNHIPIVDSGYLKNQKPDYLLLFAWNFAEELMQKTKEYQAAGGRYIIPIPNVRIL